MKKYQCIVCGWIYDEADGKISLMTGLALIAAFQKLTSK